jgi:hypothetical protein
MPFDLPAGAAPDANTVARASADGRTFAWWRPESTPQGLCVLSRGEDGKWAFARGTVSPGYAVPSPDGQRIFTLKGTFGLDARPLPGGNALALTLPATSGEGFVRLGETTAKDGFQGATAFREAGGKPAVSEPDVELAPAVDQWKRVPLAFDRRVVFVPEAKLLILVPSAGEKLLLRLLD